MRVTVVTRRRARPGLEAALVAAAVRLIEEPSEWTKERRAARLFRGRDEPDVILYVADWNSMDAYWARMRRGGASQQLDALCSEEPERRFFQRLWGYEIVSRRAAMASIALIATPPAATTAVRDYIVSTVRSLTRHQPGFVLSHLHQELHDAPRFLLIQGWESPEAWEAFIQHVTPRIEAALHAWGATLRRFVGIPQTEHYRRLAMVASSSPAIPRGP